MSDDLAVLVPTRSRPHTVVALAAAFLGTTTANTWLVFCVDGDEHPQRYRAAYHHAATDIYPRTLMLIGSRRRLVGTLNHYAERLLDAPDPPYAIGFMGDDHRPETVGWDTQYLSALRTLGTGLVYGDDGLQHANLPTAVAITTDIVGALGFYAPPALQHMYCDNFWKDLGDGAGCLTYLPDVKVTHHHPGTGQVAWDDSYRESNAPAQYAADEAAYARYRDTQLAADIATITALRGAP